MLIGINGKIGSGKDTVGRIIQHLTFDTTYLNPNFDLNYKWFDTNSTPDGFIPFGQNILFPPKFTIKKFAGKLKQIATILTGIPIQMFEDQDFKKAEMSDEWAVNGMPITIRQFLQLLGTEAIRDNLHPNAWVNALFTDYKEDCNWIITDLRFPNEFAALKRRNALLIRVIRPGLEHNNHPSETALDSYVFDEEIVNEGSIDDLINKVKDVLVRRKLL